jgi:hypothetical protein
MLRSGRLDYANGIKVVLEDVTRMMLHSRKVGLLVPSILEAVRSRGPKDIYPNAFAGSLAGFVMG